MALACLYRQNNSKLPSSSSDTATAKAAQQSRALRRSARLHSTVTTVDLGALSSKPKKKRVIAQPVASTSTIVDQPRTLRSQKRNSEQDSRIVVTPPITALKKRKTQTVEADNSVVKKKRKQSLSCLAIDAVKVQKKSLPKPRSPVLPASRIATRSTTKSSQPEADWTKPSQPPLVTLAPLVSSPPVSPPSSPPLTPATYPNPLEIVDIGVSAASTCPAAVPVSETPVPSVTPSGEIANAYSDLNFDPSVFFTPENNVEHTPLSESEQQCEWSNNSYQFAPPPELLPPPRRPRQPPLWIMACKMRLFELEKYYPRNVIRSIVAQQANDYYSVHGLPSDPWREWGNDIYHDEFQGTNDVFLQHDFHPLTADHQEGDLQGTESRAKAEAEDDTDEEDDSDDSEGYDGDLMQLDVPVKGDDFNAELTSSLSTSGSSWSSAQSTSPLMTTFALPGAQPTDSGIPSEAMPLTPDSTPFLGTPPPMMSVPTNYMPVFPWTLPRLSSVKVMSLRSMFDVMESPLDEEDDPSSFEDETLLSSATGMSPEELHRRPRKRRRDGMGNGTPIDPMRRAIWASTDRGNKWGFDATSLHFGMDLGLDGFVNNVSQPPDGMQVDLNPLLENMSGDMEGAAKQYAALQQVYEVFSGSPTGYST